LNRFYVRDEDQWRIAFFKMPPCRFDNFIVATTNATITEAFEHTRSHADEALRRQHAAEAQAAEAIRQQRAKESEAAERIAIMSAMLVRAKRESAEAFRREQTAEAEAAKALAALRQIELEHGAVGNKGRSFRFLSRLRLRIGRSA
jgi:hypothetical protein